MPRQERSMFGGWVPVAGEKNMYVPKIVSAPVPRTQEFSNFAERSRARWDLFEYLKVILKQNLRNRASRKH
jgi:hypothetical protein